jgi:pyrimidine-nucleoside phosphorylase
LEVIEAIEILRGRGPDDLRELCRALAAHMLSLAGKGDYDTCLQDVERVIASGEALDKLAAMVRAQGGDARWVYDTALFPKAPFAHTVYAPQSGYITHVNTEEYGVAALLLGAGRSTKEDVIDLSAGIYLHAKTGDYVKAGDPIATLYASREDLFAASEARLLGATEIGDEAPAKRPLIFEVVK